MECIAEVALPGRIRGTYPHLVWGIIEVKRGSGAGVDVASVMEENIEKLKGVFHGVARYKRLDMAGLVEIVVSFIDTLSQEVNVVTSYSIHYTKLYEAGQAVDAGLHLALFSSLRAFSSTSCAILFV